jgi:carboxyl-terminal processing protease
MLSAKAGKFTRAILLAALVLSLAIVIGPSTGPLAKGDETYEKLKIFSEVLSQIESSYVEEQDSEKLIYGAIRGMMKELDSHSAFLTEDMFREMQVDTKGEFGGLGITIGIKNDILTVIAPIEDTPAWKIGILAGDKILKVEDEPTKDMTIEEAVKKMRGTPGTEVTITIMREGFEEPKDFTIVRDIIKLKSVKSRMLPDNLGLVRITQFQERTSRDLDDALKELSSQEGGLKGLILDLRNNPGGLLDQAVKVTSEFLPANTLVVSTKGRKTSQNMEFKSRGGDRIPGVPMVVLTNHGSASASEIVAGALQDWKRALILGIQTFGKGSVQTVIPLEDGSGIRLTTAKYYTPKGRSIQNKGIEPDIVVSQRKLEESAAAEEAHSMMPGREMKEEEAEEKELTPEEKALKEDYQMQRAADIIKSWNIFQKMDESSATSSL